MTGYAAQGDLSASSECPNCEGGGVVPEKPDLAALAAACGALPGDDCPNCEGRGVLDIDGGEDPELLEALAAGMSTDLIDFMEGDSP